MRGAPSTCAISPLSVDLSGLLRLNFPTPSLLLISLLLLHGAIAIFSAADLNSDAQALLAFKDSTGNIDNRNLITWSSFTIASVCTTWSGVICGNRSSSASPSNESFDTQRVISLRLPASSLFGEVPLNTIGKLDAMETLSLRRNRFSGELPADLIYNCTSLKRIFLQSNKFSGPLPPDISSGWPNLLQLDLSDNNFSGSIPPALSNPGRLKSLYLQNNSLSGPLPAINGGSSLTGFSVAYNNLSGSIPSSLSNFSADSFVGNDYLCGYPLPTACSASNTTIAISPSPSINPNPNPNPTPTSNSVPQASGPDASRNSTSGNGKLGTKAIIGIAVAAAFGAILTVVLLMIFMVYKCCKEGESASSTAKKKKEEGRFNGGDHEGAAARGQHDYSNGGGQIMAGIRSNGGSEQKGSTESSYGGNELVFLDKRAKQVFDLEELLRASAEVMGKGSLGTAYKAMMDDGRVMVVKRLREVMSEKEEFKQKMEMMGRLQHPNLVPPRAYYYAHTEKLLVLDYMPLGSLSALLHGNMARLPLDWAGRLGVAQSVARVMAYLHSQKVVHGNLKSSNILQGSDDGQGATWRLVDYGLVQLAVFSPTRNVKLMGYIAPEISDMRSATAKADVYSYGVLLLELLTGKSPILTAFDDHTLDLPKWVHAALLHNPDIIKSTPSSEALFDPILLKLHDLHTHDDMMQLLHISLLCTSHSPHQRPSMQDIVTMIDNIHNSHDLDIDDEEENSFYGDHE